MADDRGPDNFQDLGWKVRGNWQRLVSLTVAVLYLAISVYWAWPTLPRSTSNVLYTIFYLTFVLACIWFAEDMGEYYSRRGLRSSPAVAVRIVGWFLLVLPVLILSLIPWLE